jgi:hypothetical protein
MKAIWTSPNLKNALTWQTFLSNASCRKEEKISDPMECPKH